MGRDAATAVLEAAWSLVGERGAAFFTYAELAKRAGVSRQTVYASFPDRGALIVALADYSRTKLNAAELGKPIFEAATARQALEAVVDFHCAYTLRMLAQYRAAEFEQLRDPEVAAAFRQRSASRTHVVRHVVTRLDAEGQLSPEWTIDTATDVAASLLSASFSSELLQQRGWTPDELHDRLFTVLQQVLLIDDRPQTTKR